MPTENRSSNTEMVSDSEMTECQFHNNCGGWCETRRELEHNLCEHCLESHDEEMSDPAQALQPKAEPATPYGWHVEWADSGDHYLFTKVEKRIEALRLDSDVKVVQLYTHADPGEVERLRAENEKLREGISKHWKVVCDQRAELEALRAKLTERHVLLREIADHCNGCVMPTEQLLREWGSSIDAALSASAGPSAPTWSCRPCKIEQPTDRPCDACSDATELKI